MTHNKRVEDIILIDSAPPPPSVWERTWEAGQVTHYQALYKIDGSPAPPVGVRITIQVDRTYPERQSYAAAEVFNGSGWNAVSGLPPQLMKCIVQKYGNTAKFSLEGLAEDVNQLLSDAQHAWDYRVRSND
jgi:hypothetical protein